MLIVINPIKMKFLDSDDIKWEDRLKEIYDNIKKYNNYEEISTNEFWINKINK